MERVHTGAGEPLRPRHAISDFVILSTFVIRNSSFLIPHRHSDLHRSLSPAQTRQTFAVPPMSKPTPKPIDPAAVRDLALAAMRKAKFPFLATIDGGTPRVRPVSPVRTDEFTVYVANLRQYHKTAEIAANSNVELCYLDDDHDQVRITGVAEIVTERGLLEEIWSKNALLRQYLGSIDNPELIVYRIKPNNVRFMREWALEYHGVPI
jgi:general stress protein 26